MIDFDRPALVRLFEHAHRDDIDAIKAAGERELRRLDAADALTDAAIDAVTARMDARIAALAEKFTSDFIVTAVNSALALFSASGSGSLQ